MCTSRNLLLPTTSIVVLFISSGRGEALALLKVHNDFLCFVDIQEEPVSPTAVHPIVHLLCVGPVVIIIMRPTTVTSSATFDDMISSRLVVAPNK